ncbi:paraquat-inducible protein A [Roseibacillus ishigakijimensis]|uniref:Paraquat-inducible protein A n=1 Tax=Roseibacillus ishigakijimensis TaxID=454146 RepID=A0A934RSM3_9BACT|nr:paraquat-inducible protein A [Roseibacillus ishigakijimensis]MBK1834309.1 paraquat-inducible protein A [Roseibacillus ishigakijimensis]
MACPFCDTLQEIMPLAEGETAHCRVCGTELYQNRPRSLQHTVAYCLAGLFLMVLVLLFPFLSMNNSGLKSSMTVWSAAGVLWQEGSYAIAIATAAFIVIFPIALLAGLLYVVFPLIMGWHAPGAQWVFRQVTQLQTWVMVEVFFLAAIVSLLKLVKLADITLGQGFWAFALLVVMLVGALSSIDQMEFWDRLEAAAEKGGEG